ncbi:SDR family NAD(P)-dependent oxidoreductase [Henriciella aquimarina]|uniref:SDR family NAD(P)-dependent oxidoreductase n=1 Tax=Henriciella aquimarina TaxID=545261 RepID=UPI000A006036|nr:SDR family NAD(P)-dependent oxidoreductase [Henriciella aquimarina]
MGRLENKTVFITGTAGGQGRAAAEVFAREGAHIIGCDIKESEANETVDLVRTAGGKMDSFLVDLTDPAAAAQWIQNGLDRTGRIDVLYNNAGNPRMSFMGEMTQDEWSHTIRAELDIIFHTVSPAWRHFLDQGGGAIINTASVTAHRGYGAIGQAAHAAAKGGILAMTKQLAAEGASLGIRANTISPGTIITPAMGAVSPEQLADMNRIQPVGRAGKPEDIAYIALYLASDEAAWVTGSDFVIDGGISSIIRNL